MNFENSQFDIPKYLDQEACDLKFRIEFARENEKGAFEVTCIVASGPFSGRKAYARFWRNKETGNWTSLLKFFLTRFPGLYIEDEDGHKTIRSDVNTYSFLKGKHFYADSKFGPEFEGRRYIRLENFRSCEESSAEVGMEESFQADAEREEW